MTLIIQNPELRPAFDGGQLTGRAGKLVVFRDAFDIKGRQHILQMTDHQRIFGGIDLLHCVCPDLSRTNQTLALWQLVSTSSNPKLSTPENVLI